MIYRKQGVIGTLYFFYVEREISFIYNVSYNLNVLIMYRHKCAMNWRREITFEVKCRFYLIYGCYEYLLSVVDASVVLSNRVGKKGMKFPIKINTRNH